MDNITLGDKIRALRLSKQMTQKELAGDFITRNMLSQIENNSATPSMKTMEHLAKTLNKPLGYFLDDSFEELNLSHLITRLIQFNNTEDYETSMLLLNEEIAKNPKWENNHMVMNLFSNSHMVLGNQYYLQGKYEEAYATYMKIIKYEQTLLLMSDIYLYKVYDQLAETATQLKLLDEAKLYYEKGKNLINKMVSSKEVQSLYLQLMEGEAKDLLEQAKKIDTTLYDPYSLGRLHMVVGSSLYRNGDYEEAIQYLEKALEYYKGQSYSSVTTMIYEELSKCYSELNDYKKAYEYLHLAADAKR